MDFTSAETLAREQAERMAEGQVLEALEENLPAGGRAGRMELGGVGEDGQYPLASESPRPRPEAAWPRSGGRFPDRARPGGDQKIDLSEGEPFLQPGFGVQTACDWVRHKFGIELSPDEVRDLELPAFKQLVAQKARATYEEKEMAYPVMAGLYHFTTRDSAGHKRYDREELAQWAAQRFGVELSLEDLKNKQREEIRALAGRTQPASSPRVRRRPWPRPTRGWAAYSPTDEPAEKTLRSAL